VTCQIPAGATVVPAAGTSPAGTTPTAPAPNILGITVEAMPGNSKGGGVKVMTVAPDSPCKAVLKPGDVIYVMNPNGKAGVFNAPNSPNMVTDLNRFQSLVSQVHPGSSVGLVVSSGNIRSCQIPAEAPAPAPPSSPTQP